MNRPRPFEFIRRLVALDHETRKKWVRLALQRLAAVWVSNLVLGILSGGTVVYGKYADVMPDRQLNLFFGQEFGVVVFCFLFYVDPRRIFGDLGALLSRGRDGIEDKAEESTRNPYLLFAALFFAILWNFWVIGRFINATGGITGSPFGQFAVTLLVLGQLMATSKLTMFIIFALGVGYVWALLTSQVLFGLAAKDIPGLVRGPENQYLAITAVSLAMSFVVNQLGIPKEKTTPAEDGKGEPESNA